MTKLAFLFLMCFYLLSCGTNVPLPIETTNVLPTPTPPPTDRIPYASDDVFLPWKHTIGSTEYRWNGTDFFVRKNKGPEVGIFLEAVRKYRASFEKSGHKCLLDSFFTPSAVVGDLVSYEHESGFGGPGCGVSSGQWRYATVDVTNSNRFLDLRNYFSENDLLRAFLANPQLSADVQKSIADKKLDAVPATLKDLSAFLTRYDYQIFNGYSYFEPDYLQRFVFHQVEGERICVRVSASSTSTAGRAIHAYAKIFLPIPAKLRGSLQKADVGNAGFLMKHAATKVGTKPAMIELRF